MNFIPIEVDREGGTVQIQACAWKRGIWRVGRLHFFHPLLVVSNFPLPPIISLPGILCSLSLHGSSPLCHAIYIHKCCGVWHLGIQRKSSLSWTNILQTVWSFKMSLCPQKPDRRILQPWPGQILEKENLSSGHAEQGTFLNDTNIVSRPQSDNLQVDLKETNRGYTIQDYSMRSWFVW